jgi:hypothetical protein
MNFDQIEKKRDQLQALVNAVGRALPDYLEGTKLEMTNGKIGYFNPSKEYPGFWSLGHYISGHLIDKVFMGPQSFLLKGISIRKWWGGKREIVVMVERGHMNAIRIIGEDDSFGGYRLNSVDASKVVLEPFEPKKRQDKER